MYIKVKNKGNLSLLVSDQIKQLIQKEKFKPGDKLPNEIQLTELFGVSRPTIREAIKILASQNIIEIISGKGTFVTQNPGISSDPLGLAFIDDKNLIYSLIEVRLIIEPQVAKLAAQHASDKEINKLQKVINDMKKIMKLKDDDAWIKSEFEFHKSISYATKNPVIMRIVPIIHESIIKTLKYAPRTPFDHKNAIIEHSKILQAIIDKDAEKSMQTMQQHLENSYRRTVIIGSSIEHE
ncbi:MAG: FadR family transcriptional regulator [Spirochaetes bacterium]|nr:FadR family transcriptional regulator [Spirochaetota bacterium]